MEYPQVDRNNILERKSLNALSTALPEDRFIFRRAPESDFGVDGIIELIVGSGASNMCAQVQLKATEQDDQNQDGSISVSVTTRNVRHLLNGVCPIFILYIEQTSELRFAWVWDEEARLSAENPTWSDQDTVSVRFKNLLVASLDEIYLRIRDQSLFRRRLAQELSPAVKSAYVNLRVDTETLQVNTGDDALWLVEVDGISLVNAGRIEELLQAASIVPFQSQCRPKYRLVLAYAHGVRGSLLEAWAHFSIAKLGRSEFNQNDERFLTFLEISLSHQTGRITTEEFCRRQRDLVVGDTSSFGLGLRLEAARRASLSQEPDADLEVQAAVDAVRSAHGADSGLQFQARVAELTARGVKLTKELTEQLAISQSRLAMGIVVGAFDEADPLSKTSESWEIEVGRLLQDAGEAQLPVLQADICSLRLLVRTQCFMAVASFSRLRMEPMFSMCKADIDFALDLYRKVQDLEGEVRIRMQFAALLDLFGRTDEAKGEASQVLPIAEAIGITAMVEAAQDIVSGNSWSRKVHEWQASMSGSTLDFRIASTPDDQMEDWVRHNQATLCLPDESLPILRTEAEALREAARYAVRWCQHFVLVQDLRHTQAPQTIYRLPLQFRTRCMVRGLESPSDNTDASASMLEFRSTNCTGCNLRLPQTP